MKPYVYQLTHKVTGQFYIGYRQCNDLPAYQDLPIYQSSSATVKAIGFENFDWIILAEFDSGDEAYDFEQKTIGEWFGNHLCLNKHYIKEGGSRFKNTGHSEETKAKISEVQKGKPKGPQTEEHKANVAAAFRGKPRDEETKAKISETLKGRKIPAEVLANRSKNMSEETKRKISEALKGKPKKRKELAK